MYADAHKTVTLDVDGQVTKVSTFSGSVDAVLDEQGVRVGDRDVVVPATASSLKENAQIVVRYGHEVTVLADGKKSNEWVAALDADDALNQLASRGTSDVRLVASRSSATGRTSLPLRLDADGPVSLVVDGKTIKVEDGTKGIDAILDGQKVALGELDRVSIRRDEKADPSVSLVVQRVKVADVSTTKPVPFETVTEQDASRYADLPQVVKQEGVAGVHTTVNKVTTVDGVEESRTQVSDGVTTQPVTKILVQGTKVRPKATPKATKASKTVKSQQQSSSSQDKSADSDKKSEAKKPEAKQEAQPKPAPAEKPAASSGGDGVWAALARCESGGNPSIVSSNGKYHGLYQFTVQTWRAVGGSGLPSQASASEQTMRAKILQQRSGWGQWPACSRKLGLR